MQVDLGRLFTTNTFDFVTHCRILTNKRVLFFLSKVAQEDATLQPPKVLASFLEEVLERLKKVLDTRIISDAKVAQVLESKPTSEETQAMCKLYFKVRSAIQHYSHLDERVLVDSEGSSDDE